VVLPELEKVKTTTLAGEVQPLAESRLPAAPSAYKVVTDRNVFTDVHPVQEPPRVVRDTPKNTDPPVPGTPKGACCLHGGSCVVQTEEDCEASHGEYKGDGTRCGSDTCNPPSPPVGQWRVASTVAIDGELRVYVIDPNDDLEPPKRFTLNDRVDGGRIVLIRPTGMVVARSDRDDEKFWFYKLGKHFEDKQEVTEADFPELWDEVQLAIGRAEESDSNQ
jgi:hypothetical protein